MLFVFILGRSDRPRQIWLGQCSSASSMQPLPGGRPQLQGIYRPPPPPLQDFNKKFRSCSNSAVSLQCREGIFLHQHPMLRAPGCLRGIGTGPGFRLQVFWQRLPSTNVTCLLSLAEQMLSHHRPIPWPFLISSKYLSESREPTLLSISSIWYPESTRTEDFQSKLL